MDGSTLRIGAAPGQKRALVLRSPLPVRRRSQYAGARGIFHRITGIKECVFLVPNVVKFTKACQGLVGTSP
jgi:hypothetical protein